MTIEFRALTKNDDVAFRKWLAAWEHEPKPVVSVAKPLEGTYKEHLEKLSVMNDYPIGRFVPAGVFYYFEDAVIKGGVSCRWSLNEHLLKFGGHIGYGVGPVYRRQGIATEMLKLSLEQYRKRGISPVLVTAEDWNIASQKIIEANGGVLENFLIEPKTGKKFGRYWIDLKIEE
jgi:predicted acetyltransferase